MTDITADERGDFIGLTGNGRVIMEFFGKELAQGEPDTSNFPNGGIRTISEARGYTT